MKRRDLLSHLMQHGCALLREGARHSWWHHPALNTRSAVPRHIDFRGLATLKDGDWVAHGMPASCVAASAGRWLAIAGEGGTWLLDVEGPRARLPNRWDPLHGLMRRAARLRSARTKPR